MCPLNSILYLDMSGKYFYAKLALRAIFIHLILPFGFTRLHFILTFVFTLIPLNLNLGFTCSHHLTSTHTALNLTRGFTSLPKIFTFTLMLLNLTSGFTPSHDNLTFNLLFYLTFGLANMLSTNSKMNMTTPKK